MNAAFHRKPKINDHFEDQWEKFDRENGVTKEDLESIF